MNQIEDLERQHQAKMGEIQNKQILESNKYYGDFFSGLQSGLSNVLTQFGKGTTSIANLAKGLFTSVLDSITGALAKMAAEQLMTFVKQTVMGKTTAASQIADASAVAGANAFAATAAIPIIGPELAPAAGVAASAGST